ncbi:hypothetical protein RFI_09057, partial [Reticulomyxa filosa]
YIYILYVYIIVFSHSVKKKATRLKASMECAIHVKEKESTNGQDVTDLMTCSLEMPHYKKDWSGQFEIQWYRNYYNSSQRIAIEDACDSTYVLSADDIGAMIQVGVTSVLNKDVKEYSSMIGPVHLSKTISDLVCQHLEKLSTNHDIEFQLTPNPVDATTMALLSAHLQKSKTLVIHFNRQKVKLRNSKNITILKQSYNSGLRIKLHAYSHFSTSASDVKDTLSETGAPISIRFKQSGETFQLLAKTDVERELLAILLRTCCQQAQNDSHPNIRVYQHVKNSNEMESFELGAQSTAAANTEQAFISKMLEPYYKSKRQSGTNGSTTVSRKATLTADSTSHLDFFSFSSDIPTSAMASPTTARDKGKDKDVSTTLRDVDDLFPLFESNDPATQQASSGEGGGGTEANENDKSGAWKKLELIDASQAKVATEEDLAKVSFEMAPGPGSKTRKKTGKQAFVSKKKNMLLRLLIPIHN